MSRLVWIPPIAHISMHKNPPEMLIAALKPRLLMEWRKRNRWADALEMIVFTDDDPPRDLTNVARFAPITGEVPHCVVNYPFDAKRELDALAERPKLTNVDAAKAYNDAVIICARRLRGVRCAWIEPESDHGFGAVAFAATTGMLACYSGKPMIDSIGAMAAARLSVNITTLGSIKAEPWIQ